MIQNRKSKCLLTGIKNIKSLCVKRGFQVHTFLMDNEFEHLRGALASMKIHLNIVSKGEHIPEIERYNRIVKEQTRFIYSMLPFKKMPSCIVIEMVYSSVFWLNMFPHNNGVSDTIRPQSLINGLSIDYHTHCRLEFGSYAQVHEEHDNSMTPRTTGAIALSPTHAWPTRRLMTPNAQLYGT